MPEQTKMAAYAVSLNFAGGPLILNMTLAESPEAAVATVTAQAIQQLQIKEPLQGVAIVPIPADWLDFAVRAVKGKLPEGGNAQVLQLVPPPPTAEIRANSAVDAWRSRQWPWGAPDDPGPAA